MPTEAASNSDVEVQPLAKELTGSIRALLDAIPDSPHKPTPLARTVGINRVIASKLLRAIAKSDPYEAIHLLPGPDSLRTITAAAGDLGVPQNVVHRADQAVEQFAELIRDHFGTRDALDAAISQHSEALRWRFEHASRYDVFKGMRQVLGVDAETWLTCMIFAPHATDDTAVSVTTMHGALGMRRLRPDVNVSFSFGPPYHAPGTDPQLFESPVALQDYYTHDAAELTTEVANGQLVHRLASTTLGKNAQTDMLAVSHSERGSLRWATPERRLGGVAVFLEVPVKTLICDALVHESVFSGSDPELIVYNPGARGPANPNDRARDIDRVVVPESVESLGCSPDRFDIAEVPHYGAMVAHVFGRIGHDVKAYRLARVRMQYPVHGFQFVMAFEAPERPAGR